MATATATRRPRLKERYDEELRAQLREKNFMKIVSLAPEVL